jgi:hypothetical protein
MHLPVCGGEEKERNIHVRSLTSPRWAGCGVAMRDDVCGRMTCT